MSTTDFVETPDAEVQANAQPEAYPEQEVKPEAERPTIVRPEHPITGFVFIQDVDQSKQRQGKVQKRRTERFLHGLVVPGVTARAEDDKRPVIARNRMLLMDKHSYPWFQELMAAKPLPEELEGVGLRMQVRGMLRENVAFVLPMARSLDQAVMEWKTHQLKHRDTHMQTLNVIDEETLSRVFYARCAELYEQDGMFVSRIYPNTMTALSLDRYGFFYKLSGAERMKRHIGKDGTNGMILDRDIRTVFRWEQIEDVNVVNEMLADKSAIKF